MRRLSVPLLTKLRCIPNGGSRRTAISSSGRTRYSASPCRFRFRPKKARHLLDELVQYKNYIEEDYGRIYEDDDNYRNDMIWSVLVGEGDDIRKHLLKVTKDDADGAHPVWMHYYYGPMLASQSWTKGLGQGGFHSSASSAASGG